MLRWDMGSYRDVLAFLRRALADWLLDAERGLCAHTTTIQGDEVKCSLLAICTAFRHSRGVEGS